MRIRIPLFKIFVLAVIIAGIILYLGKFRENQVLKKVIERLSADSRIAEIIVTGVKPDPKTNKTYTTIKFLEYDSRQRPLAPKYFTFSSDIIQFQSLVIRFDDYYVKRGHPLKGRSAYLFMKAFSLQGKETEEFQINRVNEIPSGYAIGTVPSYFERKLWRSFWEYAFSPRQAKKNGIKNAQIEAPGTKFVPGVLYTIKIEHHGGMRIDTQPLPQVLRGETIGG